MTPSTTFFVLPDLHGRLDALQAYLRASGFADEQGSVAPGDTHLIQLGDLLDRGPHPRACVDLFMRMQAQAPERVTVLKGNHEAWALAAAWDTKARATWMQNGGGATLADYDGEFEKLLEPGGAHYTWLDALPLTKIHDNVLFCHAGLGAKRKGALDPEGLLWDRPPLSKGSYRSVVCGHTPTASGRMEHKDGVFYCDLGLGHKTEKGLQYLRLSISAQALEHQFLPA